MNKFLKTFYKRFKKFRKNKNSNSNIFVVCIAVVMVWRGLWGLLDVYVFPNCYRLSCVICLILGLLILIADDGKIDELE